MKIGNRSSVLDTGIWKMSDMSQVQERKNAIQPSQTQSIAALPSEAQRKQQINEFKSQEQLMRLNIFQKLEGKKLDKQMDGPMTVDQMGRRLRLVQEILNSFEELGSSTWTQDQARAYAMFYQEKVRLMDALASGNGGQRQVVPEGQDGPPTMGARPSRRQNEIVISDSNFNPVATGIKYPSVVGTPGRGRWRSVTSNHTNNDSDSAPRNQKSDNGPKNVEYGTENNSSNDSHASSSDNRSYTSVKPEEPTNDDYENNTHDDQNDIDIVSPAGYAPGEYPTLSGDDPMTGHDNQSGNDIGASGRIPKGSPDNRSGLKQMVQPAINLFSTTTGADDEEHPNTGNAQGTPWNPSDGDDLGDDLPYDLSGNGGSIDIEAGKVLLEQIHPINPGGPDPTKRSEK